LKQGLALLLMPAPRPDAGQRLYTLRAQESCATRGHRRVPANPAAGQGF